MIKRIDQNIRIPLPPGGVRDLTDTDIRKLADDFLKETNLVRQEKFLRVFNRIKYPYDYRYILELSKKENTEDDSLIEYAVDALR